MKSALLAAIFIPAPGLALAENHADALPGQRAPVEEISPLQLRINLTPGAKYRTRIEVRTDDSTIAGPKKDRYTQNGWLIYKSQVLRNEAGGAVLKASFEAAGIEVGDGRTVTVFDSRKPRKSTGKPGSPQRQAQDDLSNVVKGMAGENCTYSISTDGKRLAIRDLEPAVQRMIVRMKLPNKKRDAHLKGIMRGMVKGFLGNTDKPSQMTGLYPLRPVAISDSWRESYLLIEGGTPMQCDTTFTLESRRNGIASIALSGPLSNAPAGTRPRDGRISNVKTTGASRGRVQIEESSGWILSSTTQIQSTTAMDVNVGQKVRVTMVSKGAVLIQSARF